MPIILSIAQTEDSIWAAGPEGLFLVLHAAAAPELRPVMQPQQHLYCCAALHDRILVGGAPFGIAFSLYGSGADLAEDATVKHLEENWQSAWLDDIETSAMALTPAPNSATSGVLLAGTEDSGILRTTNWGRTWETCNFGLQNYTVLALAWAPPAPEEAWPRWEMVFAATEDGMYRSPAGGRGWKLCAGTEGHVFQAVAVSPAFHADGVVLAGSEASGLWHSGDGGRHFQPVPNAPQEINALAATVDGWLLSGATALWRSPDGLAWEPIPGSAPALVLASTPQGVMAGGESGLAPVQVPQPA